MDAVGIYGLALKFGLLLKELIVEPFQRSFGAFRFSVMKQENAREIQARTLNYLVFVTSWAGLGISVLSEDIVRWLATPEYHAAASYIPLVVLANIVMSCGYVFQTGILYQKRTITLFYVGLISGIAGVCISIGLIFLWGVFGVCLGLVLQYLINVVLTNMFSQKLYKVDYSYSHAFMAVALSCIIYLVCLLLPIKSELIMLAAKGGLLVLYPYILVSFNFFTADEKAIVFSYAKKLRIFKDRKSENTLSS